MNLNKKRLIIHPFLFAAYPLLHLWAHNVDEVSIKHAVLPIISSVLFAAGLWAILYILMAKPRRTAIITSVLVFMFFSYGHIYHVIKGFSIFNVCIGCHAYLLTFWGALSVWWTIWLVKTKRKLKTATILMNFASVVLISFPLINVTVYGISKPIAEYDLKEFAERGIPSVKQAQSMPNVYYIVLDGYSNANVLKDMQGFDNSDFINFLKKKGFYVVEKSRSNYPSLDKSLKSSLNIRYLRNVRGSTLSIENNKVMRIFKKKGYEIINFPSGYYLTTPMKNADVTVDCGGQTDFIITSLKTTVLSSLTSIADFEDYISKHIQRIFCTLNKISWVHSKHKKPVFVFAHIICPHPPYVFSESGILYDRDKFKKFETINNFIDTDKNWSPDFKKYYIGQIKFLNGKLKYIINEILSYSKVPPLIIIQSGNGSAFNMWNEKKQACVTDLSGLDYKRMKMITAERIGNLNAYYVPEEAKKLLYDSITPINTFRIILDVLFNIKYGLSSDRIYWYDLTELTNVTKDYFNISR